MEKRRTIFDYFGSVFMVYGITIIMLLIITQVIGNDPSNMFSLGSEGLSTALLIQFLIISCIIIGLQYVFFTEAVFKEMSQILRTIGMLGTILIVMSTMIILFDWFPDGEVISWILFISFFLASFGVSITIVAAKERLENKQMAEGLDRYKASLKKEKDHV